MSEPVAHAAVPRGPLWKPEPLTGWGRARWSTARVADPASVQDLVELFRREPGSAVLARGCGRSYGDAAMNRGGSVIRTLRLTRIHAFDERTGAIIVEPGVSFDQLLATFAPQGWIAPVTPGTQFATIGGAIANDVHGKNHDREGSFGDHVHWFELLLPDGAIRRVDPTAEPELFAATVGGIGLTGIILRVAFQMKRVPSNVLLVRERRVSGLEESLDVLAEVRTKSSYSVGWIDGIARGGRLGRGILETAEHVEGPLRSASRRRVRMPIDLPAYAINSMTVACFNRLYYLRIPRRGRERQVSLEKFFYPLDSILDWNRLYGRRGFVQFQCVIPDTESRRALRILLERISASGRASFLAVIKTLGRPGRGYLSFPRPGVTLALDFPLASGVSELLDALHGITIDHGGRVYLAKDACLTAAQFRRMYPDVPRFEALLDRIDPGRRLRSDMSSRLQL